MQQQGLAFMLSSRRTGDRRAAAALAHMLTTRLCREAAHRVVVHDSDIVPAMVALLGERDPPAVTSSLMLTLGMRQAAVQLLGVQRCISTTARLKGVICNTSGACHANF